MSALRVISEPTRTIIWLRQNESSTGGILTNHQHQRAYQEVTGYLIPTLLSVGEKKLADRCAYWLVSVQQIDGGFVNSNNNRAYVFDTAQCLRGLLAMGSSESGINQAALKAAEFIMSRLVDSGHAGFQPEYRDMPIEETIHLYVLEPLLEAADRYCRPEFRIAAENALLFYKKQANLLKLSNQTHFLMYEVEALFNLGLEHEVLPILKDLAQLQKPDGAVYERDGETQVCVPGLAQLALCWYLVGWREEADRAMDWLDKHQEKSGGFLGSYGARANYFNNVEIPWAAKYYLDAHLWRIKTHFNNGLADFSDTVSTNDGRLLSILNHVYSRARILEVGCGKGRFLKRIKEFWPDVECMGIDPSRAINMIPKNIHTKTGTIESIPYPDQMFDLTFSVETLEHAVNPEKAIREMVRVTKRGGWIVIIDKQRSAWGRLECPSWEVWPDRQELLKQLDNLGVEASAENIIYDDQLIRDGLMVSWSGHKQ